MGQLIKQATVIITKDISFGVTAYDVLARLTHLRPFYFLLHRGKISTFLLFFIQFIYYILIQILHLNDL